MSGVWKQLSINAQFQVMSVLAIVLLILVGFILILVELFVIPGVTIAGIGALILIGGGIFSGYYFHDATTGNYILLGTGLGMFLSFILALKLKTWQRFGLRTEIEGRVGTLDENAVRTGDTGRTVSRLAPIGKAIIKDILYEVRSEGGYIDSQKEVSVIRIDGNKIYVELK